MSNNTTTSATTTPATSAPVLISADQATAIAKKAREDARERNRQDAVNWAASACAEIRAAAEKQLCATSLPIGSLYGEKKAMALNLLRELGYTVEDKDPHDNLIEVTWPSFDRDYAVELEPNNQ